MSNKFSVFVYGTLMGRVQGVSQGIFFTIPEFKMGGSGFPKAVYPDCNYAKDYQSGIVKGELFTGVSADEMHHLDAYEGAPTFYKREEIEITNGDETTKAWMYIAENAAESLSNPNSQQVIPDENKILSWPHGLEQQA